MKKMKLSKVGKLALFSILLLSGVQVSAQYTYIGLGFEYHGTTFDRTDIGIDNTVTRGVSGSFNVLARPLRNVGIGVSIGAPIIERFKFNFENSPTTDDGTYYDDGEFSFGRQTKFIPTEYEYTVKMNTAFTFKGRFFVGALLELYADLRYTSMNVEENYKFVRPFSRGESNFSGPRDEDVPAVNIDYSESFKASGLGLSLGYMPHLSDYVYMDMSVTFDYLNYKGEGFKNNMAYDYDSSSDRLEYVDLESRIPGNHLTFRANLGVGVYF